MYVRNTEKLLTKFYKGIYEQQRICIEYIKNSKHEKKKDYRKKVFQIKALMLDATYLLLQLNA